jgi:CRP-like cAMP-binding protein
MPASIKLPALCQTPLFASLSPSECEELVELGEIVEFQPGETVLQQGKTDQNLYVLLDGDCEVVKRGVAEVVSGDSLVLATLAPSSSFGEMSFFDAAPHSASVRAKTRVVLFALSRAKFDVLVGRQSSAAFKLACNTVASLSNRLREMNEWVAKLVRERPAGRSSAEWSDLRRKLFDGWTL